MHVVYERCCGIDVHKKFVVVCLSILTAQGAIQKEIRTFTTMTPDLLRMLEWLKQAGCSHAALESTGVYWKPIHNLLETERVLEERKRPVLKTQWSQRQSCRGELVRMVTDLAMCPPRSARRALVATKSGKTTMLSDKTKRRKSREPGKPFGGIRLK